MSQRYISTSFWDDAWIQDLDSDAKLLYMYLLTSPLTNIAGVYKITSRRISFDTGISRDLAEALLQAFEEEGKAAFVDEYIILPNWPKHQKTSSKDTRAGIDRVLSQLPENIILALKRLKYAYDAIPDVDPKAPYRPPIDPPPLARPTIDLDLDSSLKPIPSGLAAAAPVDNSAESEEEAFETFLMRRAIERQKDNPKIKNLEAYAKSLRHHEDVIADFKAFRALPPPPPPIPLIPDPPPCVHCGKELAYFGINNKTKKHEAGCQPCRRTWTYDDDFLGAWVEDQEPGIPLAPLEGTG